VLQATLEKDNIFILRGADYNQHDRFLLLQESRYLSPLAGESKREGD
jgi:hypothetical protein